MISSRESGTVREIGNGVYAYLQRGGWGFSNAGLVVDGENSLLVDTLYDVPLTLRMLAELRRSTRLAGDIGVVVNTHANGDHCWGNQAVRGARIVASRAAAAEMRELSPKLMAALVSGSRLVEKGGKPASRVLSLLGRLGVPRVSALRDAAAFIVDCFGAFEFDGIRVTPPTETFAGRLELRVGDRRVELIEVGPAHTKGDVVVHLPDSRIAFTGDILFIGSHPIMWEGPVENWIRACDRLLALDVDVIVPGHGPLTTKAGVQRTKEYWKTLLDAAQRGVASGVSPDEIARDLFARGFDGWTESSRVAVNIDTICRDLKNDRHHRDPLVLLAAMGRLERERGRGASTT